LCPGLTSSIPIENLLRNLKFFQLDFPACQAENSSGIIFTIFPISSIK